MIPEDRFLDIAKGLFEKTKQGKVNWKLPPPGHLGLPAPANAYMVQLPNALITLMYCSPRTEPDFVMLIFQGPKGPVGSWKVEEGSEHWRLANSLYSDVTRYVTGWDKVLEEVEQFIKS